MASAASRRRLFGLLFVVLASSSGWGQTDSAGVQVKMNPQNPWSLRVTLRSSAKNRVTFFKNFLPWGNRYSMVLVAVTSSGRYVDRFFPEDEPSMEEVSLGPGESVTGDVDLHDVFTGLDDVLRETDVQLFWAYKAPEGLGIPRWSGGWILIPQHKQKQSPAHPPQ
jgi:hypothetical protein